MRLFDWLKSFRLRRQSAHQRIGIRKTEHREWMGHVALLETLEQRIVLAAPTATDGNDALHMNSTLWSSVSVADADSDPLTVSLVDAPMNGTVSVDSSGSFSYTPNTNFVGTDSFTFQANDGVDDSNVATFTITIGNTAPTVSDGSDSLHMNSNLSSSVTATDTDGDSLTISVVDAPTYGILSLDSSGSFSYTPNTNFVGTDSFTFQANDGVDDSNVATFTITIGNNAPIAGDDYTSVVNNSTLTGSVSLVDDDEDPLTVSVVEDTTSGTLSLNADGSFTYIPNDSFEGIVSFTFQATDGAAYSNIGTYTISVVPPPITVSVEAASTAEGDAATSGLIFTVSLSAASNETITVNYGTADGTAASGIDYTAVNGLLTFDPGQTSKTITVDIAGDTDVENDETFVVLLFDAEGATTENSQAEGWILNDDEPLPSLSISEAAVIEGNSGTTALVFQRELVRSL